MGNRKFRRMVTLILSLRNKTCFAECVESFISSLKTERTARKTYRTCDEASHQERLTLCGSWYVDLHLNRDATFKNYGVLVV